ncbi:Galactose oxidase/kelch beta-propeller [Penicillium cf. griseofulvum]|uniref:Galactose oxidase/kelch beta-propeller n=1 Tax=Penicillium cf. griseofulvum TaxID=2972120 RepID=A0A9W9IV46_9EURO|nr:Galactose oxidase/kelch beta-propeller [Penicillium cf. griseofulvum]KAJ5436743.1 Galactose oxidase/kelch beta-propeller [Penicillium cf. griseofulvum]
MKGPKPTIKIEGDCSTIHSDTFYVYSPDGFASISLKEGEYWKSLPSPDHMVTSPACVQGSEGDENFYLVGGTGSPDNSGLQRFSFSTGKWETLTSTSPDMKNRTGHGAGYIPSTSRILVYAGNTDGSTQISQSTLIISTKDGSFDVSSVTAQGAPALYEPMILPWSSSEVAMIGGSPTNTDIFIYDSNKGFGKSEATLPSAIQSSSRCALASNSGGKTKVLEEFTMIASPNTVTSYLLSSKGKIQNPATVIAPSEKRDITDSYNGTFAPTASWSDYTLAQGSGLVVLASGQSNDSLAIFNQTSNSWVNSTELFYGKPDQNVLKASTTSFTSSTPTSTSSTSTSTSASATPTSSSPVVAAVGSGLSDHGKLILGATLGSVLGFGLILLILLFLLRREKKKRQAAQPGGGGDNKDRLSFQDQGIEPLTEGAYPMARSPVPLAATSVDSLAIMSGKYKGEKSLKPPGSTGYGLSPQPKSSSPLSTIPSSGVMGASSVYTEDTNRAGDDTGREHQAADRMTDEGWGKYFEDGGTTTFQSDRSTVSSAYTKSDYRGSGWPMSTLTPLNFGFLEQPKPLGRVPSGSPTTEHGPPDMGSRSLVIPESQSARISSADSISIASDDDRDDSKWQGAGQSSWLGRPSSSNYTTSFYQTSTQDMPWESSNPSLAEKPRQPNARRSSVIIPHDIHELPMQGQKNTTNSDMSWLNLKADR